MLVNVLRYLYHRYPAPALQVLDAVLWCKAIVLSPPHTPPYSHANVVQGMCFTLCIRPCQLMLEGGNLVRRMKAAT